MSHIDTKCIHGGWRAKNGETQTLPIYQSTTYRYDSADFLGDLFDLSAEGHIYSRISNPTLVEVEKKINALEGGVGAMLTASGQSASLLAVLNICENGDNFLCSKTVYGGTYNLFFNTLQKFGIEAIVYDQTAVDSEIISKINEKTKLIFGETIANPSLRVFDIERFAKIAHTHNIPLMIDNTFPSPALCRPFLYGADIIVHSTSKYLDGHAVAVGGVIVDSGNFDWEKSGKFGGLSEPDDSHHGVIFTKKFGKMAYIMKARAQLLRDTGAIMSPQNAFLLNLNMETLSLRMKRHCENAIAIAEFLEKHEKVSWVNYPLLKSSKDYDLAKKYLPNGASGVISFGLKEGRDAAKKVLENFKLITMVTHVCDNRTCAVHPASTTHRQMNDEQLKNAGVSPEMIRLSVGIENIDDLIEDLKNALG